MRASTVLLFAIMLALFFVNVMVRILIPEFSSSIGWAEEAARIAMIWAMFLVAGLALDRGRHIAMTSVVVKLPEASRLALRRVIALFGAALFGYFCYICVQIMLRVFNSGQVFPSMGVSSGYLYMGPAIGLGLLALRYVVEIIHPNDPANAKIDET
jgi:TRAP-type C4-dicarboxylate transport system permease small subunit